MRASDNLCGRLESLTEVMSVKGMTRGRHGQARYGRHFRNWPLPP